MVGSVMLARRTFLQQLSDGMTSHERGRKAQLPACAASIECLRVRSRVCGSHTTASLSVCVERSLKLYIRNILHSQDVTSPKAHSFSITKTSRLTLFREIIVICRENTTKLINTLSGRNLVLLLVTASST
jgi:hypothetical protein